MDLLEVSASIKYQANIHLKYIDESIADYTLNIGDVIKIAYLKDSKIQVITGKIINIVEGPINGINLNNDISDPIAFVTIYIDISKEYDSSVEKIISSQIRGINDTAEKYLEPEESLSDKDITK